MQSMMQPPTVRPWGWPGWDGGDLLDRYQERRRLRLTLHDLAKLRNMQDTMRGLNIDWNHLPKQEIAVYVPKNLRHLIRFDSSSPGLQPGLYKAASWPSPVPTKRPGTNVFNLFPFNHDFEMPDLKNLHLEPISIPGGRSEVPRSYGRHWEDAARAWAGAALIVLAFVLFIRAIEKCIHSTFSKPRSRRRRASSEWETPTVFATSYQNASDQAPIDPPPRTQDSEVPPSEGQETQSSNDLPPPYSECANAGDNDTNKYIGSDEPPPPYSACYVAYSNPKGGLPSVHFLNRRREDIFLNRLEAGQSSATPDVSLRDAENAAKSESGCDDSKTELVFENGRVIPREGNVNSEGNARDRRNGEYVVNISEPGSTNVPDRSLQV